MRLSICIIDMRAGISTASLFLRKNNEECFSLFRELGVDCTEVFFTSFCEYFPSFASSMVKEQGDIFVNSVHTLTTNFEPQLYAVHPKIEKDSFDWLDKVLRSAQILGAKYYTFHGVARIKRSSAYNDFKLYGPRTQKIIEVCKRYGVSLAYENVEWSLYNHPGVFTSLKEYCPDLKGVLDIKQARISGYDYREYLTEMGGSIAHVHVSDVRADGKMCLPGKGTFDFGELIDRLQDVGFDGCVLIEAYAKDYGDILELKESYEFLQELLYKKS